jgi:predicted metal-dependent peptidase
VDHLSESDVRQLYADPAGATRQARDKLAAARVWLMKHKPFFGVLARAFRLEASLTVPAYRLFPDDRLVYNPLVVLAARFPAVTARLAHLALHGALGAFGRRREREARRWNVACDLAIAPLLEAAELGVGAAPRAVFSDREVELPRGASAEAYFPHLAEGVSPDPLWCDLCDVATEADAGAGQFTRQDGGDDDGASSPGADGAGSSESPGHAPVETRDAAAHELQWKMRLAAAIEEDAARGHLTFGDLPGWLDELLRATIEPPADWSAVLQQSIHQLHRTERSYLRPSRRMSALVGGDGTWPDLVTMPGRRIESAGRLVAVVDTSASLPTGTLARFLGALVSTAAAEGIDELRLVQADCAVTHDEHVFAAELLFREVGIVGRGGTDFGPALRHLAEDGRRQGQRFTVVYLTDLDGRFPEAEEARSLDVLWVVPSRPATMPPFGRVLEMGSR